MGTRLVLVREVGQNMHTKLLAAAAGLSLAAGAASAKTVEFVFTDSLAPTTSYSQTVDGLTVTITAGSFVNGFNFGDSPQVTLNDENSNPVDGYIATNNTYDDDAVVDPDSNGLGVINNSSAGTDDQDEVDGSNWDDFLILSFSGDVQLKWAKFGDYDANDDFRIFYDFSGDGVLGDGDFLTYKEDGNPFSSFPVVTTDLFGFAATDKKDNWKLKKLKVHYTPVPLPAAGFMLLAGLGGLAAMKRRKRAS